ncbi:Gfo/Idh/MocA family protein [Falsibacillus albus]|uniref:Gfo/Idh/MocA family oxidoreductase n=1 Tax=Falsibacillus albus TaxID=2478915 RepID=A0A3L7JTY1_9BACI|nr:Gfo/Idh/MocA family oxidoreductase [Falsibacillus albus]RLQ93071.1 gfo/Idh/MocA family oxidoreductase [Falsibacillus albus]
MEKNSKIRAGMIGLGAIGVRMLEKFSSHENIELTAVCEPNQEKVDACRNKLPNASFYTDYRDMLKDELDLVYIGAPPKFHHDMAVEALKRGMHVICEKPLANSLMEAEGMALASDGAGVTAAMNFPLMYNKAVSVLEEKLAKNEIGAVKRAEVKIHHAVWPRPWQQNAWIGGREQGGFIREITPHYIQLIHHLFGSIKDVQSFVEYPEDESLCETGIIAQMKLEDGTSILVDGLSGIGEDDHVRFKLYGEHGTLSLVNWSRLEQGTINQETEEVLLDDSSIPTRELLSEVAAAIQGKKSRIVDFKAGLEVQTILEQLLQPAAQVPGTKVQS